MCIRYLQAYKINTRHCGSSGNFLIKVLGQHVTNEDLNPGPQTSLLFFSSLLYSFAWLHSRSWILVGKAKLTGMKQSRAKLHSRFVHSVQGIDLYGMEDLKDFGNTFFMWGLQGSPICKTEIRGAARIGARVGARAPPPCSAMGSPWQPCRRPGALQSSLETMGLNQWFCKCSPYTSSNSTVSCLLRNMNSLAPPKTSWIRNSEGGA